MVVSMNKWTLLSAFLLLSPHLCMAQEGLSADTTYHEGSVLSEFVDHQIGNNDAFVDPRASLSAETLFPTETPAPSTTFFPTETLFPTETPAPSTTSFPTETPAPSLAPIPTETPVIGSSAVQTTTRADTTCPEGSQFVDRCFESLMDTDLTTVPTIPANPDGAAGMNSVIAVSTAGIEARTKNGDLIFGPTPLAEMFRDVIPGIVADLVVNPKIIYDVHQSRFVVCVVNNERQTDGSNIATILVAVSKAGDPNTTSVDDWWFSNITSGDEELRDQKLAVDEEALYVTSFRTLWIIAKEPLYDGGEANVNIYFLFEELGGPNGTDVATSFVPAMVRSPEGVARDVGTYLVGWLFTERIQIVRIDDPLGDPTFTESQEFSGFLDTDFSDAPQPGTSIEIDTGRNRVVNDAVWVNNTLWAVTTTSVFITESESRSSVFWVKLAANGVNETTILDQGFVGGGGIEEGTFTYFGSLDVNSNGVAAFGFSASSPFNIFVSAYATIRDDTTDEEGTSRIPDVVKAGLRPYNINEGEGNLWGGYSGMALDPEVEECFWAFNAYAGDTNFTTDNGQFGIWKTAWARLCFPPAPVEPTMAPVEPPTLAPIVQTVAPVEPTPAPIEPTTAPVEPTMAPVEPTMPPVEPTMPPVEPTMPPVEPTMPPVEPPTMAPVEPTMPPVEPTIAPVEPTMAPVEPTMAPVEPPTMAPVEPPTPAPFIPTVAPVEPTPAPIEPTMAPVAPPTLAPITPTLAPVEPTRAPTIPTLAPVEPTRTPTIPTPAPVVPTAAPITPSPTTFPVQPTFAPFVPTTQIPSSIPSLVPRRPRRKRRPIKVVAARIPRRKKRTRRYWTSTTTRTKKSKTSKSSKSKTSSSSKKYKRSKSWHV